MTKTVELVEGEVFSRVIVSLVISSLLTVSVFIGKSSACTTDELKQDRTKRQEENKWKTKTEPGKLQDDPVLYKGKMPKEKRKSGSLKNQLYEKVLKFLKKTREEKPVSQIEKVTRGKGPSEWRCNLSRETSHPRLPHPTAPTATKQIILQDLRKDYQEDNFDDATDGYHYLQYIDYEQYNALIDNEQEADRVTQTNDFDYNLSSNNFKMDPLNRTLSKNGDSKMNMKSEKYIFRGGKNGGKKNPLCVAHGKNVETNNKYGINEILFGDLGEKRIFNWTSEFGTKRNFLDEAVKGDFKSSLCNKQHRKNDVQKYEIKNVLLDDNEDGNNVLDMKDEKKNDKKEKNILRIEGKKGDKQSILEMGVKKVFISGRNENGGKSMSQEKYDEEEELYDVETTEYPSNEEFFYEMQDFMSDNPLSTGDNGETVPDGKQEGKELVKEKDLLRGMERELDVLTQSSDLKEFLSVNNETWSDNSKEEEEATYQPDDQEEGKKMRIGDEDIEETFPTRKTVVWSVTEGESDPENRSGEEFEDEDGEGNGLFEKVEGESNYIFGGNNENAGRVTCTFQEYFTRAL